MPLLILMPLGVIGERPKAFAMPLKKELLKTYAYSYKMGTRQRLYRTKLSAPKRSAHQRCARRGFF